MTILNFLGDLVIQDTSIRLESKLEHLLEYSTLNIVNFEAPIHTNSKAILKSGPSISQSTSSPEWLARNNFHCVSLSNNHICDFGPEGIQES